MTCIVGWTDGKGNICIGGDSAGVAGLNMAIRADEKVFRNGEMLFGFTSSFRMGQLLRFSLEIPSRTEKQDSYDYMCTDFIDAVRKCLKDGGYAKVDNGVDEGGCFIVGYRGQLYVIESDFQVGKPVEPFDAVGCGESFAKGVSWALKSSEIPIKAKVEKSLEAAHRFSAGVRPPYVILTLDAPKTKDTDNEN
jgi:ATP-dependent protease HslVU (ClpYQ) peptidase subunit